jgi:hypothetical protein
MHAAASRPGFAASLRKEMTLKGVPAPLIKLIVAMLAVPLASRPEAIVCQERVALIAKELEMDLHLCRCSLPTRNKFVDDSTEDFMLL